MKICRTLGGDLKRGRAWNQRKMENKRKNYSP
jgi:hypothetical protein